MEPKTVNIACTNINERLVLRLDVTTLSQQENVIAVAVAPFGVPDTHPFARANNLYLLLVPYTSDCYQAPQAKYHLHLRKETAGFSGSEYTFARPTHLQTSIALRVFDDAFVELETPSPVMRLNVCDFSPSGNALFFSPTVLPKARVGDRLVFQRGTQRIPGVVEETGDVVVAKLESRVEINTVPADLTVEARQVQVSGNVSEHQLPLVLADYWSRPELQELFESALIQPGVNLKKKIQKKSFRVAVAPAAGEYSLMFVPAVVCLSF
jgi:hypothetical protein